MPSISAFKEIICFISEVAATPAAATPPNAKADIPPPNRPPEALLKNVFATLPTVG